MRTASVSHQSLSLEPREASLLVPIRSSTGFLPLLIAIVDLSQSLEAIAVWKGIAIEEAKAISK